MRVHPAIRACEEAEIAVLRLEPRAFFDRFILGLADRCGSETVLAYDLGAIHAALVREQGMTEEEADEHLSFNVLGAWMGEKTPIFISVIMEETVYS
jgi:hypothetical protein